MNNLYLHDELFDVSLQEVTMVVSETGLPRGHVRLLKLDDKSEPVKALEDIAAMVSDGEVEIRRKNAPRVSPVKQADTQLDEATIWAMRVTRAIKAYAKAKNVSKCVAYDRVKALVKERNARADKKSQDTDGLAEIADLVDPHEAAEPHAQETATKSTEFPSRATFYRYLRADRRGLPLLCGDKNKGNRTPRYKAEVVNLVIENAQKLFLQTESRWSFASLTKLCTDAAQKRNYLTSDCTLSRKFVQKVIFENLSTDTDWDRMDRRTRAAQKAIAKNRIRVDGPLQRVEQDALHLPWRVRTADGVARNIWLVHSIDCATSMPLGWHLVVGSPNASSGLHCVESGVFSKKERLAALGLEYDIDFFGAPSLIVFDNGAEANNDRMHNLTRLGIDVQYCKSRHPHHKPFIERLNRAVKEGLETLPGCTRLDGVDGMRNPEELNDLPMDLVELERWIVRWYFEDWANRVLDRLVVSDFFDDRKLGGTPRARLASLNREGYAMPLPPNRTAWLLAAYVHDERTLSRTTGITYDNFHFRGTNLPKLIARSGEKLVKVLIDPDDFRTVHVQQGDALVQLVNIDVDETTPALSFPEANVKLKEGRALGLASGSTMVQVFRGDVYAKSSEKPGRTKRGTAAANARQVAQKAKSRAASERARKTPLPPSADSVSIAADLSLDTVPSLNVVNRNTGATV